MSDSVLPHRRQPTRLLRPWDSPGKNTGVGCHFLLQCMKVKSESEVAQSCPTLSNPMDCSPPGSFVHGIFQARVLEWGAIAFSYSWALHKSTDSVGPMLCAFPRSEQLRGPGAWGMHSPQVGSASYHLPSPSSLVSWVHCESAISGVLCVSSGKLISGCDPPGGCRPSRIPRRLG